MITPQPASSDAPAVVPPQVRLDTIDRVRREAAQLYADSKAGCHAPADAFHLGGVLVGRLIEGRDLKRRVAAPEQANT